MSDNFMLSAAEREMLKRRRRRLIRLGVSLVLVLALGLVLARPVRHRIRSWQARRHAEKAMRFLDAQNFSGARDEATAAYQLQPNEPPLPAPSPVCSPAPVSPTLSISGKVSTPSHL